MTIKLYNNSAENNRVDKTDWLSNELVVSNVILKDGTSIIRPSLTLAMENVSYNYLYIQELQRYYFIVNVASIRTGLWRIDCRIDVLMSYKTIIKNNTGLVSRNQFDIDELVQDDLAQFEYAKNVSYTNITNSVPSGDTPITELGTILGDNDNVSCRWVVSIASGMTNALLQTVGNEHMCPQNVDYTRSANTYRLPWIDKYKTTIFEGLTYAMNRPQIAKMMSWCIESETRRSFVKNVLAFPYNIENHDFVNINTNPVMEMSKIMYMGDTQSSDTRLDFTDSTGTYPTSTPLHYPKYCMSVIKVADFTFTLRDEDDNPRNPVFTDYSPYTTYELYCPYYGYVKLDLNDIVGDRIQVWYYTSLNDGTTTMIVYNRTDDAILFTTEVQMVSKLSLDATNSYENSREMKGQAQATALQTIGSAAMLVAGIVGTANGGSGLPLAVAGAAGMATSLGNFVNKAQNIHDKAISSIGSPSSGLVNTNKCYWRIVKYVNTASYVKGGDYDKLYGRPCMKTLELSNCKGFTQVSDINLEGFTLATADEISEIKNILQSGVLFEED